MCVCIYIYIYIYGDIFCDVYYCLQKKKKEYDKSTDIYSLGLIALMMFYPLESETEWIRILERTNETKCPPSASNAEGYKLLSDVVSVVL